MNGRTCGITDASPCRKDGTHTGFGVGAGHIPPATSKMQLMTRPIPIHEYNILRVTVY